MYTTQHFPDAHIECEHIPTVIRTVEMDKDGNSVTVIKDLDLLENPLKGLSYEDFSIKNLLAAGVELKHLPISPDTRMGVDDSEIEHLQDVLMSRVEELYQPVETK